MRPLPLLALVTILVVGSTAQAQYFVQPGHDAPLAIESTNPMTATPVVDGGRSLAYPDYPDYPVDYTSFRGLGYQGTCCEQQAPGSKEVWDGFCNERYQPGCFHGFIKQCHAKLQSCCATKGGCCGSAMGCCEPMCASPCGGPGALWWPVTPGCGKHLFGKLHGGCCMGKGAMDCCEPACDVKVPCQTKAPCQTKGCGPVCCEPMCGSPCGGPGALWWPVTPGCGKCCGIKRLGGGLFHKGYGYLGDDCCTTYGGELAPSEAADPHGDAAPTPAPEQPTEYRLDVVPPAPSDQSAWRNMRIWSTSWN